MGSSGDANVRGGRKGGYAFAMIMDPSYEISSGENDDANATDDISEPTSSADFAVLDNFYRDLRHCVTRSRISRWKI